MDRAETGGVDIALRKVDEHVKWARLSLAPFDPLNVGRIAVPPECAVHNPINTPDLFADSLGDVPSKERQRCSMLEPEVVFYAEDSAAMTVSATRFLIGFRLFRALTFGDRSRVRRAW